MGISRLGLEEEEKVRTREKQWRVVILAMAEAIFRISTMSKTGSMLTADDYFCSVVVACVCCLASASGGGTNAPKGFLLTPNEGEVHQRVCCLAKRRLYGQTHNVPWKGNHLWRHFGSRPGGWPRARWMNFVSHLARECPGTPQEVLGRGMSGIPCLAYRPFDLILDEGKLMDAWVECLLSACFTCVMSL